MTVVDLEGGGTEAWIGAPVLPKRIVCVNVAAPPDYEGVIEYIQADACTVGGLGRFDVVYSNSTV